MNTLREKREARRMRALQESDRVREIAIDNVTQAISDIRKEVEKYRRYDEELAARRADVQRMSEALTRLQQQVLDTGKSQDERFRGITYLEEQRLQDNKRIAQLQVQSSDMFKKIESQVSRIQQLEQFPPRISELRTRLDDIRQQQTKELERAQFQDAQRERQMKSWLQEAELHRQRMDDYGQQLERYAEQHHRIKKAMDDLQEFKEQLQSQQHETTELQRLAENRQRSQLQEWQVQEERRWKKQAMEWEHQWSDYDKALADLAARIPPLDKRTADNEKRIQLVLQMAEEDMQMRTIAARDWQMRFEDMIDQE
jgi:hypothetical protein